MSQSRRRARQRGMMQLVPLEPRTMLSALQPLPSVPPVPVKMPMGLVLPKAAAPVDYGGKIQTRLWTAVQPVLQRGAHRASAPARSNAQGAVQVTIQVDGPMKAALSSLKRLGVQIQSYHQDRGMVQAWVRPNLLRSISRIAAVRSIGLPDYAIVSAGTVDTAGDSLLLTDQVRARFANLGIDGSGVKVGVISDGVNHAADVGEDLPAITVNPSLPGSGDEGTAMLEIVHDLAPAAELYFSGPLTSMDMIDSINYLVNQGCNVIIDDLTFPGEPYFADGPVAQAAQAAVDAGVVYISAAGNSGTPSGFYGDSHYQSPFNNDGVGFHDFDPGQNIDDFKEMLVLNGASLTAVLQWSDPFGGSGNDYDLYLLSAGFSVLDASTDFQVGDGDPIEAFTWVNNTGADQFVRVLINWYSGLPTRELEMFTFGAGTGAFDHNTPEDSIIGQQAAPGVIAVTAINAADPGTDTTEFFASQGPSTIYTDFNTQTSIQRNSLDGATIDGVETNVGQLGFFFNPFFGTSVAGPHAAGIVALMLEANPTLAPAQVAQFLGDTAVDLTDYGIGYDQISGAGRFNALDAVFKAMVPPPVDLAPASDSGISDSDNITNDSTPTFTGPAPAGAFVTLYVDGIANQSAQLASGETTYALTTTALPEGPHQLEVRMAASSTIPEANFSFPSVPLSVLIDLTGIAPPSPQFLFETGQELRFTFAEDVSASFSNSDLVLNDLTSGGTVPTNLLEVNTVARFGFPGPLPDGNYLAIIPSSAVTDVAGNPMTAPVVFQFFVLGGDANRDRIVDARDLYILAINWLGTDKTFSDGDFNYDGQITAADLGILSLNCGRTLPPPPLPPFPSAAITSTTLVLRPGQRTPSRMIEQLQ